MSDDYSYAFDNMTREDMVEKMRKGWISSGTKCGFGSEGNNPNFAKRAVVLLAREYMRIANVGAGDLSWWPTAIDADHYDLIPTVDGVQSFDCTLEVLPHYYDVIVCRFVLNHISVKFTRDALRLFQESSSKFLLLTSWPRQNDYWREHGLVLPAAVRTFAEYRSDITLDLIDLDKYKP